MRIRTPVAQLIPWMVAMLIERAIAGLVSTVLIASSLLQPIAVYAESSLGDSAIAAPLETADVIQGSPDGGTEDSTTDSVADSTTLDTAQADGGANVTEDASAVLPADVQLDVKDGVDGQIEATQLDLSKVEFVYVDQNVVRAGDTQHIAIGLASVDGIFHAAHLRLINSQGEETIVDAASVVDSSMLFSIDYTDDAQADSYRIDSVVFSLDGSDEQFQIDLQGDEAAYAFDATTGEFADSLSADDGSDDGITANTMADDGSLELADSVEDTLVTADEEGVSGSARTLQAPWHRMFGRALR